MTGLVLKIIAYVSMIVDHVGYLGGFSEPVTVALRCIGRVSFPLFAFMICEGYRHTRNRGAYFLRILVTGIVSAIPYSLCFYSTPIYLQKFNVMFTLGAGLFCIYITDEVQKRVCCSMRSLYVFASLVVFSASVVIAYLCAYMNFEYGTWGVLLIYTLYLCRNNRWVQGLITVLFACQGLPGALLSGDAISRSALIMTAASFAAIPILLYNGKRGYRYGASAISALAKYSFYAIYPLHLLLLYIIF